MSIVSLLKKQISEQLEQDPVILSIRLYSWYEHSLDLVRMVQVYLQHLSS